MTNTSISFETEIYGYNKDQVDNYIKRLSDAYQETYGEYQDISNKYADLMANSHKRKDHARSDANSDIIPRALENYSSPEEKYTMDATGSLKNYTMHELLEDIDVIEKYQFPGNTTRYSELAESTTGSMYSLREQAVRLDLFLRDFKESTEMLAQKIIEDARAEALIIKSEARQLVDGANAEVVQVKETAQKIINEAKADATMIDMRAKRNIEQTKKIMEQALGELDKLLYHSPERKTVASM
ncbi:MAG: hypothetical protein FWH57_05260 [Oscillospiraceae bacterium]|nr:hypothetical protein [Oscillospiraceae bacterium]